MSDTMPPPMPAYQPPRPMPTPAPKRKGIGLFGIFTLIMLLLSLAGNAILFVMLVVMAGLGGAGAPRATEHVQTEVLVSGGRDKIAILPIEGAIDDEMATRVFQFCEYIKSDSSIKGVVLAVDSPGGGVTSSDEIHHLLTQLKASGVKINVSMGGLAASGGYYVSMPADMIYAQPTTITGSIGVIMQSMEVTKMMDKIGVKPVTVKSSDAREFKDAGSPFKEFTKEDEAYFRGIIDQAHTKFKKIVADGRGTRLKPPVEEVAVGKIWTSDDALALGLIDEIAYLDEVCQKTANAAGVSNPTIVRLRPRAGFFEALGANAPGGPTRIEVKLDPETVRKLTGSVLEYRYEGLR